MHISFVAVFLFVLCLVPQWNSAAEMQLSPTVSTAIGQMRGHLVEMKSAPDDVYEFSGIP